MVEGLLPNRIYSVLEVNNELVQDSTLLKMRNLWLESAWSGKWSDHSSQWDEHPGSKEKAGMAEADASMFMMDPHDFTKQFTTLYICNVLPGDWHRVRLQGEWKGNSAGTVS